MELNRIRKKEIGLPHCGVKKATEVFSQVPIIRIGKNKLLGLSAATRIYVNLKWGKKCYYVTGQAPKPPLIFK